MHYKHHILVHFFIYSSQLLDSNVRYITVFVAHDYEIQREKIILLEILGNGQFGDVHKGVYREKVGNFVRLLISQAYF